LQDNCTKSKKGEPNKKILKSRRIQSGQRSRKGDVYIHLPEAGERGSNIRQPTRWGRMGSKCAPKNP